MSLVLSFVGSGADRSVRVFLYWGGSEIPLARFLHSWKQKLSSAAFSFASRLEAALWCLGPRDRDWIR